MVMKAFCKRLYCLLLGLAAGGAVAAQPAVADSLRRLLATAPPDTNRVLTLIEMGYTLGATDAAAAQPYAVQALQLARRLRYTSGVAQAAYLLADVDMNLSRYAEAGAMLDSAEMLYQQLRRPDKLARVYNARGNWHYMQSNLHEAARFYSLAADAFRQVGDSVREIIPYQNMLSTLGELKQYQQVIKLSQRLLVRLQQRADTAQMAHVWHRLVLNWLALEAPDSARPYVRPLAAWLPRTQDATLVSEGYNIVGRYYDAITRYDSALYYYRQALQWAVRQHYQPAIFHLSIGATLLKMKQPADAYRHLRMADSLAAAAHTVDLQYRIQRQLALYYAQTGRYQQAYQAMEQYSLLNDSVLQTENREYASRLEAVYENSRKEQEILSLKAAELRSQLAIRQRNTWLLALLALGLAGAVLAWMRWRQLRLQKRLLLQTQQLQQAQIDRLEQERQYVSLQSMIRGQEAERNRIARDLHDGLGGLFSTIKMYFSSLGHQQPQLQQQPLFTQSVALTDQAAQELRRIAHNLMPEVLLKLGLVNAIEEFAAQVSHSGLLRISVQAYGMEQRLQQDTEIMLYRILQELLNNIMKHAGATRVLVQFNRHDEWLSVTVEDDGRGFDPQQAQQQSGGAGMGSIKSRVDYLHGRLNIDSREGLGTTVEMNFLLDAGKASAATFEA